MPDVSTSLLMLAVSWIPTALLFKLRQRCSVARNCPKDAGKAKRSRWRQRQLFLLSVGAALSGMALQSLSRQTAPLSTEQEAGLCHIQSARCHHVTTVGSTHDRMQKRIFPYDPAHGHPETHHHHTRDSGERQFARSVPRDTGY